MSGIPAVQWPNLRVTGIGLISGTSADGVDAAVVDLWEEDGRLRLEQRAAVCLPYPTAVRDLLFRCFRDEATVSEVCLANAVVGDLFADAAEDAALQARLAPGELAFVASHGQTIWHQPASMSIGAREVRGTLQIGEAARIAARMGVEVISDFRQQDFALGGEGAPLAPYLDYLLFAHPTESRAVQNLGGIGNVTYIPAGGAPEQVVAFDTGPANALIDAAAVLVTDGAQTCDLDGLLAASAPVDQKLLSQLMDEPYLLKAPPKSTGRELFSAGLVQALWDNGHQGPGLVSTLTQFTVETVAQSYRAWLGSVDRVILGGGGPRNPELVRRLAEALAPARVQRHEDFGISSDAKEAIAFAVFGYETLLDRPSNMPAATGASRPVIQGKITRI